MYILAYALIVAGVVVYSVSDVTTAEKRETGSPKPLSHQ
jgi:hypothetical protein